MEDAMTSEEERKISGLALVSNMWNYAATVLYPSQALLEPGLYPPAHIGVRPPPPATPGLGPHYSRAYPFPVLLEERPPHYELVEEFDRIAGNYERFTQPFSGP